MSCTIKLKHPILDFISNIGAEICNLRVKILSYIHASYGDCLANKVISAKVRVGDASREVSAIKSLKRIRATLSVVVDKETDAWIQLTLESISGMKAIRATGTGGEVPILLSGYIGKLRKGKNTVKLDCVMYQTDEDMGLFQIANNKVACRYHIDSTVDSKNVNTSMFYLVNAD